MKYICPLIVVSNIARSRNFYENFLGQEVKFDFGENVTFHGDFAIHLDSHFSNLIDGKPIAKGSNSFELYFEEDNLDELVEKLHSSNVVLVHPLREQPWRQRVVRFYDPDRNIIEVGESLESLIKRLNVEGNSINRIAEITGLEINFISDALKE